MSRQSSLSDTFNPQCIQATTVTFLARNNSKNKSNQPRRIKVPGTEFVRRWALHVLPKSFARTRCYGGYHGTRQKKYLETCRQLLPGQPADDEPIAGPHRPDELARLPAAPKCPQCQIQMQCIAHSTRPSWRVVLRQDHERTGPLEGRYVEKPLNSPSGPHLPRPET